jgi:MerR family mercuric resistance operon transcriptional regulator
MTRAETVPVGREPERLTIGRFAKACGVNVETVRFYQRKGLLRPPERAQGRIRRYGRTDAERLRFVKAAQRLGFSLDEVAQLLRLDDGTHCKEAAEIAAHRLGDVQARLADLGRIEAVLSGLLSRCKTDKGQLRCPLISSLQDSVQRSRLPSSEPAGQRHAGANDESAERNPGPRVVA